MNNFKEISPWNFTCQNYTAYSYLMLLIISTISAVFIFAIKYFNISEGRFSLYAQGLLGYLLTGLAFIFAFLYLMQLLKYRELKKNGTKSVASIAQFDFKANDHIHFVLKLEGDNTIDCDIHVTKRFRQIFEGAKIGAILEIICVRKLCYILRLNDEN